MVRTQNPWTCLFLALCLNAAAAQSQSSAKKKVVNQSDLPRFSYPVNSSATTLLQTDAATFSPFAAKVGADLDTIFRDYEVEDKATLKDLLYAKNEIAVVQDRSRYGPGGAKTPSAGVARHLVPSG